MSKVTPLRVATSASPRGDFKIEKFNLFEDDGLEKYADLRNRQANKSLGIEIENMREYSRKTVIVEGDGESRTTTTTEEVFLVVQYWERPVARTKGDSDDEVRESKSSLVAR